MWRNVVETHIIPWAFEDVELGAKILELGPGPGVTTTCLGGLTSDLTCLEIDPESASTLARRMAGNGVRVVAGDGAAIPMADSIFDGAVCFTMLHHVPSVVLQDRLLREVIRVLRPESVFLGTDSVASGPSRLFHLFDKIAPVNPQDFSERLRAAGFANVQVDVRRHEFRFRARKPANRGDQVG
ncbi:MAG: class I SAM-dependent methyltransferase [Acidobacteriaceae bacterium]|nr:class I SAM-dependent methyltransferase [Acidobacteriaceae bacterium]